MRGENERWGGCGVVYVRARKKVRERKKKTTQTIFFSQFDLIMATLLSLFLLPILCIDKLSNPTRSLLIIFSSVSFPFYSDLAGLRGKKPESLEDKIERSKTLRQQ